MGDWIRLTLLGLLLFGAGIFLAMQFALKGGEVALPDLTGKSYSAAASELRQNGINLKVEDERFSNSQLRGAILSQELPAGTRVKRGRAVYVVVSKGSAKVTVPDLGALSLRQARILLQQNGLALGGVSALSAAAPAEAVLAQFPEPGSVRSQDSAVSLLVSKGPDPQAWVMPLLTGRSLELAQSALKEMGLVLKSVSQEARDGAAPGTVLAQTPPPGVPARAGEEATLTVAQGRADIATARLAMVRYQVPDDARAERRVRISVTDATGSKVVHNEMEKPGARLTLPVRVYGLARYKVNLAGVDAEEGELP
jgi:serine/threonine-protein kinase